MSRTEDKKEAVDQIGLKIVALVANIIVQIFSATWKATKLKNLLRFMRLELLNIK